MDFNVKKSKIFLFNSRLTPTQLTLEIVGEVKYLGVIIQSDMKFTAHIHRKLMTANLQLGIIKRALCWAPTNVKLLAYTQQTARSCVLSQKKGGAENLC